MPQPSKAAFCAGCKRLIKGGGRFVINGRTYHPDCGMQACNGENAKRNNEIKAKAPAPVQHMTAKETDVDMDNLSNEDWMALQHARMAERKAEGRARPVPKQHPTQVSK